ncbi:MAG: FHA domain-containing protein [Anaerolineae bacterium]
MRRNGLDAKVALHALRTYIEPLPKAERESLAQQLRVWETGEQAKPKTDTQTQPNASPLKPLQPITPDPHTGSQTQIRRIGVPNAVPINDQTDLGELQGRFDTRTLVDENTRVSQDFFGVTSVMVLQVRGTNQAFEVRPQSYGHDIVIGRSSEQSAMHPDIDLASFQAAEMGVSRLHISMRYDADHNAIHIYDLGSSNGSYLNNQRLNAHEVRFLRDGDQLRLGRMVLQVKFKHAGH